MTATAAADEALRLERDALLDALVATQDRLSAVVSLLRAPSDTLDLMQMTDRMLHEALDLVGVDVVVMKCGLGAPQQRAGLGTGPEHERLESMVTEELAQDRMGPASAGGSSWAVTLSPTQKGAGLAAGRLHGPAFSTGDLRMLDTVAVAVEQLRRLSRLHHEAVRQTALEREHELASRLAQAVLPTRLPEPPGVQLFARCDPAALTGGDFLVFVETPQTLWFAVGDVAGKGLPAAMIMTQAVSALQAALPLSPADDPAAAMVRVAGQLKDYLASAERFVTLLIGSHRPGSGEVVVANAGHSPVVHRPGPDAAPVLVPPGSPPLGVEVPRPPRSLRLPLPPGAVLAVGTDGLVEQPDRTGRLLGYDAFVDACGPARSATALGQALFAAVEEHAEAEPAADDRTLVVLAPEEPR